MLKFHEFLKEVVFKKIPRKELMIKLHLEYHEFKGLDNITMSRWTNGVTKHHLVDSCLSLTRRIA